MTHHTIRNIGSAFAATVGICLAVSPASAQERVNGVLQEHGAFGRKISSDEIKVFRDGKFKGAHKVAFSVFNVAFPSENHFQAKSTGSSILSKTTSSAEANMKTQMSGVDPATQQRITDKAYALFVGQLQEAGYEVVDQAELARLAPEFVKWASVPNFTQGRYGAYVTPTGQLLRLLQGDGAKRDTSGMFGGFASFRALDRPIAFTRSPYIAHDGKLGIIAVTLVVDFGVYSTSGTSIKGGGASVNFVPGVTIGAGNVVDTATLLQYWSPDSGGFPAVAVLQVPTQSKLAFAEVTAVGGSGKGVAGKIITVVADAVKFEAAADEALGMVIPKLVSVMYAGK